MSLATRCTACGTVFRVVQDQLKVSEGWVRCGRCKEVFNALEGLFDLDRESPPKWEPPPALKASPDGKPSTTTVDVLLPSDDDVAPAATAEVDAQPAAAGDFESESPAHVAKAGLARADEAAPLRGPRPAVSVLPSDFEPSNDPEFADARFAPSMSPAPAAAAARAATTDADEPFAPNFLRDAERRARWETPLARTLLAVVATLLLAALLLQGGYHFRDTVAAKWPEMRPLLAQACAYLECTVGPLRRIEDIAVESSTLTQAGPGTGADTLRLAVALRSRSPMVLALPTIELSLTDTTGVLVARRALSSVDFRSPTTSLAPHAEQHLQLLLSTSGRRVAGYTIEIFYP